MSKEWYIRWHKKLATSKGFLNFWTFFGIQVMYVYIALALVMTLFQKTRVTGIAILCAFVLGKFCISKFLALSFVKKRPYQLYGFIPRASGFFSRVDEQFDSFPSGHTTSLITVSTVLFSFSPMVGTVSFVITLITGVARVVLGYHFVWDIVAGVLIGTVSGLFLIAVMNLFALY
jgi:undecaprenyl-diphosphatase